VTVRDLSDGAPIEGKATSPVVAETGPNPLRGVLLFMAAVLVSP
jgi:hypothetical protein